MYSFNVVLQYLFRTGNLVELHKPRQTPGQDRVTCILLQPLPGVIWAFFGIEPVPN
jgi:hypothetical protein